MGIGEKLGSLWRATLRPGRLPLGQSWRLSADARGGGGRWPVCSDWLMLSGGGTAQRQAARPSWPDWGASRAPMPITEVVCRNSNPGRGRLRSAACNRCWGPCWARCPAWMWSGWRGAARRAAGTGRRRCGAWRRPWTSGRTRPAYCSERAPENTSRTYVLLYPGLKNH